MILLKENDLVLALLVFGLNRRFVVISTNIPTQKEVMEIVLSAQVEINSIIAERKIMTSLRKPSIADRFYKLREDMVLFRKGKEMDWTFIAVDTTGRTITFNFLKEQKQTFSAFQINLYYHSMKFNLKSFRTKSIRSSSFQIYLTENHLSKGFTSLKA